MIIRPATHDDLPAILQLSVESLGGLGGMRTEEYWMWKHHQNPFGESPVLLAFEGDTLVGLRAFLSWRFGYQGKSFQAYRAVDTATHPDYRGKGIFSKLTLQLVEQLQPGEPAVIFNTPNSKSMPGYLKMGWKEVGKTRLSARVHPINLLRNQLATSPDRPVDSILFPDNFNDALKAWINLHPDEVITDYSVEYLQWRYRDVPGLSYGLKHVKKGDSEVYLIYRIKKSKRIAELRITEVFELSDRSAAVSSAVHELNEEFRPDVTTVLTDPKGSIRHALPVGFMPVKNRGLLITSRKVNDDRLAELALQQELWYFSAGTLELF